MEKLREIALTIACSAAFFALVMQIVENVMLCFTEEESEDEQI